MRFFLKDKIFFIRSEQLWSLVSGIRGGSAYITEMEKMCSRIEVQTHSSPHPNPNLCPFDLRVSGCISPPDDYIFTNFRVDSSSRFSFRARTDRHTDNCLPYSCIGNPGRVIKVKYVWGGGRFPYPTEIDDRIKGA